MHGKMETALKRRRHSSSLENVNEAADVDDETKLFNGEKFGAGKPNAGNAPNGVNDGKPNGRPQGTSKNNIDIDFRNDIVLIYFEPFFRLSF